MGIKTFTAATCLATITATAGLAATFTVNGTQYDVGTIIGSFEANSTLLMEQVWWGNTMLAEDFVAVIGPDLGLPNYGNDQGPAFASGFEFVADYGYLVVTSIHYGPTGDDYTFYIDPVALEPFTWAVAAPISPVPLPAGGLLLLSAFGGVAALKRRKKRAA